MNGETRLLRRTGRCLCGAVTFAGDVKPDITACHCRQCQQWTGGGPLMNVRIKGLELQGETEIRPYHHSAWGERAVCGRCGSTLYWRMRKEPVGFIAVGLLDDQTGLRVTEEIFVDYRPDWLPPFEGAHQSTEAEEMAKLRDYLNGTA